MSHLRTLFCIVLALHCGLSVVADETAEPKEAAPETRMTPELLWKLGRVGNSAMSPDGKLIAYTVKRYELKENSGKSTLFVKDLSSGSSRSLVADWKSIGDVQFAPSPFGQRIYLNGLKGTEEDAKPQAWAVNPARWRNLSGH